MNKKIRTTDLNLNVSTGTMLYVDIDIFRFLYDSEIFCITVQFLDGEEYRFLEEINLKKDKNNLEHKDLKIIALNWVFNNVEVVRNLEKITAPEVLVQEQLKEKQICLKTINQATTLFVEKTDFNCYKIEVADSKNRKKMLVMTLKKVTAKRYHIINCQLF